MEYSYIVPFTIIYKNSKFFVNKLTIDEQFVYFEDIKEKEIDISDISIPKEMKDPELNFRMFIERTLKFQTYAVPPEIAWFVYYFGCKHIVEVGFSHEDQFIWIDTLRQSFPNCYLFVDDSDLRQRLIKFKDDYPLSVRLILHN